MNYQTVIPDLRGNNITGVPQAARKAKGTKI